MRFPDVIHQLNELGRRLRVLEREFDFHHGQFRVAVSEVKRLAQALEANDSTVEGAAATLVAACNGLEKVLHGSQDPQVLGQTEIPLS